MQLEVINNLKNVNEDLHLHCGDKRENIMIFISNVLKEIDEGRRSNICISFSEHESFRVYNDFLTHDKYRHMIKIIPSITFLTSCDMEISVLNPGKICKDLFKKVKLNKLHRLIRKLEYLNLFYIITPNGLADKINKPGKHTSLHYVKNEHIIDELMEENPRVSVREFRERLRTFSLIDPIERMSADEIIHELGWRDGISQNRGRKNTEDVYIINPTDEKISRIDCSKIAGFITNMDGNEMSDELCNAVDRHNLNVFYGSGSNI